MPVIFNSKSKNSDINKKVRGLVKEYDFNIIGLDRGEKNLIYAIVIDSKGNIIEQKSLNIINNVDYHDKLDKREKDRNNARKSWRKINSIKNLKEGYVSQAVHEVVKLAIQHNALIFMENLNTGFKRTRLKFEKQIYQKFENMLVNKLSFLVDKNVENHCNLGGVLNAYQLCDSTVEQTNNNGIVFFVPAAYTSKIDPISGFANTIKFNRNMNLNGIKEFMSNIDKIVYDESQGTFVYSIDLKKFSTIFETKKNKWEISTQGIRIKGYRKNNHYKKDYVDISKNLMDTFLKQKINYKNEDNLKETIISNDELLKASFYTFKDALSLRNSKRTNDELDDYILSPVSFNGEFFDTRNSDGSIPYDSDANGAYNIALKGLYAINRFRKNSDEYISTYITNSEWLDYMQSRNR